MKLDTSHMRYLSKSDFRVLTSIEMGSKNHDIVPTPLIHSISGIKNASLVNKCISNLAKIKLISRVRNAKYDGFRLSYKGYDYLALKAMVQRESLYAVGVQIGIGKESDIFSVANKNGETLCLKVHRLGRISFRTVKNSRDYLGKRQSASWMYLSRLAAEKEYKFMQVLYDAGFSVPKPIDNSRHHVLMSLIDGMAMLKLREHDDPERLYNLLMNFIRRLASQGLIHCDFNEFNIMIREYDPEEPEREAVVIDFPQCVSIDHKDAKEYFERDVNCIRLFFENKFGYVGDYPKWEEVERVGHLDVEANASGNDRKAYRELEKYMKQQLAEKEEEGKFDEDGSEEDEFEEDEDSEEEQELEEEDLADQVNDLKLT
ncbi:Serine/threonine-protein kinase RIO2 [Wickerhamiella sorbophila]|uniref:Serine/threonine-protein kinase RIO2 n=1 Tax=Wickerhamiella sorbophila TaxID=45607 RepID=A0A2T0FPK4_9ASCO|nr:Serine/threonine-protein kinase RIO2 [Wickerhamiella sorbophila]PRT56908.1 Serine/threonine-protein kinase RIO2 [Wickerhamiella sorbophila]